VCRHLDKKGHDIFILGNNCSLFSWLDKKYHQTVFAMKNMPHPHNAENIQRITQQVIRKWNIPLIKIQAIVTDNGSNMVKTFQSHFEEKGGDDDDDGDGDGDGDGGE